MCSKIEVSRQKIWVKKAELSLRNYGLRSNERRAANIQKDWETMELSWEEAENPRMDDKKAERTQQRPQV